MMRKLCLALAAVLFSLMLVLPAHAAAIYSDGYFQYHAYDGYNSICGYFGSETTVTVPSSIAGRPVSRIEAGAFNGCDTIEKLVLPDTIMEIEKGAFSGAKNLKTIEDASGVWDGKKTEGAEGGSTDESNNSAELPIRNYEYTEPENDGRTGAGETFSSDSKSDGSKSDGSKSDGSKSDGSKSDGSKSDGSKSDGSKSDGSKSDGSKSDGSEKEVKDQSKSGVFCLVIGIVLAAVAAVIVIAAIKRRKVRLKRENRWYDEKN